MKLEPLINSQDGFIRFHAQHGCEPGWQHRPGLRLIDLRASNRQPGLHRGTYRNSTLRTDQTQDFPADYPRQGIIKSSAQYLALQAAFVELNDGAVEANPGYDYGLPKTEAQRGELRKQIFEVIVDFSDIRKRTITTRSREYEL